jgi:gas vesicle protein
MKRAILWVVLLALVLTPVLAGCEKSTEEKAKDAVKDMKDKAKDAAEDAKDTAEDMAEDVGDAAKEATE